MKWKADGIAYGLSLSTVQSLSLEFIRIGAAVKNRKDVEVLFKQDQFIFVEPDSRRESGSSRIAISLDLGDDFPK